MAFRCIYLCFVEDSVPRFIEMKRKSDFFFFFDSGAMPIGHLTVYNIRY